MDENDATDDLHEASGTGSGYSGGGRGSVVEPLEGPVGVDVGTSRIVAYHKEGLRFLKNTQLNAFFSVPFSNLTQGMLEQNQLQYERKKGKLLIMGNGAESFANITNGEVGRPMASGVMNPTEDNGPTVIERMVNNMIRKPENLGERLCFSIPGPQRGKNVNLVFHETMLKNFFVSMGYMARGVNEAFLVVLSELQKDNYTGIGISCGAGLCNVCLSYMSVPVLTFSLPKAGDYIDSSAAAAVGAQTNRVRVIKEESLNLIDEPKNRVERALQIYYEDVIMNLIQNLKEAMEESEHLPKIDKPMPIVLSGGTAMPDGFRDKFDNILRESEFPIEISDVRLAEEPMYATAKGAYLAACSEEVDED